MSFEHIGGVGDVNTGEAGPSTGSWATHKSGDAEGRNRAEHSGAAQADSELAHSGCQAGQIGRAASHGLDWPTSIRAARLNCFSFPCAARLLP